MKTGDDLLLVGVKTVEKIIEEGEDPLPCVKHLRMLLVSREGLKERVKGRPSL